MGGQLAHAPAFCSNVDAGTSWLMCSDAHKMKAVRNINVKQSLVFDDHSRGTIEYDDATEETTSFGPVDFVAMDAVPPGWQQLPDDPPDCFALFGGSACVIQAQDPDCERAAGTGKRVLLALPSWATDVRRARWMAQCSASTEFPDGLCRLRRVAPVSVFNTVVFEFDFPQGEALDAWLRRCGNMPELSARGLCRKLMQIITSLQRTPLWFWGVLYSCMVFLDEDGELCSLLPLGGVLSFRGAKRCALMAAERLGHKTLPPELDSAKFMTSRPSLEDRYIKFASDSYAAAALVLEALARVGPEGLGVQDVMNSLPDAAANLLHKALYSDCAWRLTGDDALEHGWLAAGRPADHQLKTSMKRQTSLHQACL